MSYLYEVKKVRKISVLFQVLVLYCFMISLCTTSILMPGSSFQNDWSSTEKGYYPIAGAGVFTITNKPLNVVNGFRNLTSFPFKNHPFDYLALRKSAESYLLNSCAEYIFFARNIIIRLRPTDLIFPFHYFW